ncbi:Immunoglobulin lambda constant 6 [Larimichthys crocea]|nr:Immunoglobulin lambda constant 6 [Larimichthys crocea]
MLGTLCTLITALTCVSGVTVVTQKPPVVTLRKGETATMDCNLGTVTGYQAVCVFISFSLSSPHTPTLLTSQLDSVSGVTVVTQKPPVVTLRKGETATMDCNLGTVTGYQAVCVFISFSLSSPHTPTLLTSQLDSVSGVTVVTQKPPVVTLRKGETATMDCSSLPPPVLTVFPPSSAELQSNKATLVCLSSQSVPFADVSWLTGGSPVSSGISTSTAVQQPDQTFQISSYLDIQTSDWNMDKVYTCKVSLGSQTSEKNINKSGCPTEE